jgi:outer membrane murein-binding lipoprotein Lpp
MLYRTVVMVGAVALVSCATGASQDDVDELSGQVVALTGRLEQLERENATQKAALAAAEDAIAWANDLLGVVFRNEDGDVVFSNVNVYVQSGTGDTITGNGKGNLIVGYDEDRREGTCVGGDFDGLACDLDVECTGGLCDVQVLSEKTGSHNLVVGPGHSYTGVGSIVAGEENAVFGNWSACFGVHNTVSGAWSFTGSGSSNVLEGDASAILGGGGGHVGPDANFAVVLGGSSNEALIDNSIVP